MTEGSQQDFSDPAMPDPATSSVHEEQTRADADRKKSATRPQPPEQKFRPGMKLLKENEHGIFEFVVYVVSGTYDKGKKEWMYKLKDWKKQEMSGKTPEGSLEEY